MSLPSHTRLGPYEILAPLGAGGMGEVYRARDTRLGREVAIKVLPEHLARDPAALARFEREARAVAALSHPNILALYDVGAEQGISYAVLELLEGETLRPRLAGGAMAWRKAVDIGLVLAEALAAAHAKGIFHRDLKPENIFLTSDGRVKILDFGLAHVEHLAADGATATQPGTVMGTAGYMSPEQVRGEPARAASDLFSLGCVLYEMIAGRRAFHRTSPADTLSAILRDEPPPLQAVPELERVIRHCLEKQPEQRFQSARDLAFALKAALGGEAESAAAVDSIAVLPFANVSRDPEADYLSDGITESIINSLARLPRLRVMPRSTVFRYKDQDVDPQAVGRELGARAVLTGRVILRGETLVVATELVDVDRHSQLWGERYNRKFCDIFAIEEEIAARISESLRGTLTGEEKKRLAHRATQDSEAYQLYLKGRHAFFRRTVESFQQALRYFRQAIEKDPGFALAHSGLSDTFLLLSYWSFLPGREALREAKEAALRAVTLDPDSAEAQTSLAGVRIAYDWNWREAEAGYRRAIELNPAYWQAHTWYAITLLAPRGRDDEAMAEVRKALELEPLSSAVNYHAALASCQVRRPEEAVRYCRRTLDIDPDYAMAHFWLALALVDQGRGEEALAELERVRELDNFPGATGAVAHLHALAGRRTEAETALGELLRRSQERYLDPYWLAAPYAGLNQPDQVFACLQQSCEDRSSCPVFFLRDPRLDPVRNDPRFQDLQRRIGLSP